VRVAPDQVERVGVVGAGVIGGAWAAHFLRMGLDVSLYEPSSVAREGALELLDAAWPTLERLGLREGASRERLRFPETLEETVADAQVVQEATPERLESKQEVFRLLDAAAPADVLLLSSTSGLRMTDIQARCAHPERTVVGHPFNPPYLLPLVEIVGGERTDPAAVDWAVAFYAAYGKEPVKLDVEIPSFIASRLQEALAREMLHMVAEGEATVEQIDAAVVNGPGLRWAILGPGLSFHLAGGQGGMAHCLDWWGPLLDEPWSRLAAPELTPELRQRLIDGCEREAAGRSVDELAAERDACLVALLEARDRCRDAR
jgi:carnitine 3-dehydrogenase